MSDILFKTDDYIFSYRVGGVLIHNGKVLMQNAEGDDGYAFICEKPELRGMTNHLLFVGEK